DKICMEKCGMIQSNAFLNECLTQGVINFNDLVMRSLLPFYVTLYSNRLIALFKGSPFTLHNQADTVDRILSDFSTAEHHAETDASTLQSQMVTHLLEAIKKQVAVNAETMDSKKE